MSSVLEQSILKTLIYADLFDYSLTGKEIWERLIKCSNVTMKQCEKKVNKIKIIQEKEGYYFLKNRTCTVSIRKERKKYSQEKLRIANKIASLLGFIPSVKLVGVTGALAIENAQKDDDIDLFIVSSPNLLWTTRFLATILVELTGRRRHPKETSVKDKICLNMFVDEDYLSISLSERDLFTAYEIVQMKPIYDKDKTYQKFLEANLWVKKYLPNGINIKCQISNIKNTNQKSNIFLSFSTFICDFTFYFLPFTFMEKFFRNLQLWYMRKRRTTEVITGAIIRFHPHDARKQVLKNYKERLKSYKVA